MNGQTKDLYRHPEAGLNATISETRALMRLLNEHGIFAGWAQIEMAAVKNATLTAHRVIAFEDAEQSGFSLREPLYITFQVGRESRTTAGYLARLFRVHGPRAMAERLYAEHVSAAPGAWERHLLSLPGVSAAVDAVFQVPGEGEEGP